MGNQGNPGDQNQRDDQRKPTGTSGRQSGNDTGTNPDTRPDQTTPSGGNRRVYEEDDDEESGGLGNRTSFR